MESENTSRTAGRGSSTGKSARKPARPAAEEEDRPEAPEKEGLAARLIRVATGRSEPEPAEDTADPVEMLKQDHDKVRKLFKEYEEAGERGFARKKQIVEELTRELTIHAQIEEKIFYQAFRNVSEKDPKKLVRESFEEHKIVKTLLAELSEMRPQDGQYDAKVTVLQESVEHHADEEEDELFPQAEKIFDDDRLRDLGEQMKAMKEQMQAQM